MKNKARRLVLESGETFEGIGFGAGDAVVGEIVFNTSMVGYQEIISDPAYAGQIVVMTYPPMGQYGITDEDFESKCPAISGMVVREYCDNPSNFRYTKTLSEELSEHDIPGISGLDTRMLTSIIRDKGFMKAAIVDEGTSVEEALSLIRESGIGIRPVEKVSCAKRWFRRTPKHKFDVVMVDCGVKHSLIDAFIRRDCNVTVVPFNTSAAEILKFQPDGVVLSSGPGDPRELPELVEVVSELKGRLPICGISLGHQIIALSYGASITRLKAGHHGGRPVKMAGQERILTVEHNHNYEVDLSGVKDVNLEVLYKDVVDGTVEGLFCGKDHIISCQFYPEGAPGPEEEYVFDSFVNWMNK